MKEERERILQRLMHKPLLTFNQLWEKKGPSNAFAYHLKILEEDGFVGKTEKGYKLTHEGKKYATYVDGSTGAKAKFPLIGVLIVVLNDEEDKILMIERLKEPFYGHWGVIGGKLEFSEYIIECAQKELKGETGLTANLELKGLFSSKTYNNNKQSYNHQMFVIKGKNPRGKLIEKTREGECKWIKIKDIPSMKTFPNVLFSVKIAKSKGFRWVEADRMQENDEFTGMKVIKDKEL